MSTHEDRLRALRAQLSRESLDGFVVPLTDEYLSEYVGAYAQRLAWLTGFLGSAGSAVVLPEEAAIFTDGRYTLQVRDQVDGAHWQFESVPQTSVAAWLGDHAPAGGRIGYDPWLHTRRWVEDATSALAKKGAILVPVESNPVDAVWDDRPHPSKARLIPHEDRYAGRSSAAKRADMADWMKAQDVDATVLTALDSIAWTFNIRGADVTHTPVALAYALLHADGKAEMFVDPAKIDADVRAHLGNAVTLLDRAEFITALGGLTGKTVAVDPDRAVSAIFEALDKANATIKPLRDPAVLPKAVKNETEITGHKAAQARDGAAMAKFLRWLSIEGPKGGQTEISVSDRLQAFREETGALVDLSFDTISGSGPNGAIVHYKASAETCRPVESGTLLLVDSGGQYRDGTTDITRTMAIGTPSDEMRHRFTLVLKGHIALACARFPAGTRGSQLDVLARQFLWAEALDYAHGTGHGVGSFLSVHEGPQRIATASGDEPLQPGMILSNEPGYYKTGAYGIRIENLVLVVESGTGENDRPWYAFETLSHTPIDRVLIEVEALTPAERDWVNAYHARTLEIVGPQLEGEDKAWLEAACAPL
ncbi:MAG: aminopeptidase P family protein [Alphaproteobacteria bacterium]|nr:aminopeptidase P family protein [Alphaproteobacteria bacterium]MBU0793956.1 aminopeptidase P family protein [Alphaproteobacteria bacterium]MBU0877590.1 aminopeptidase P family protein [Alphaproteobacteria bacterium]MBU1770023.1 aminopeptidase P family protein [Alphaproteobacteria bacterium]